VPEFDYLIVGAGFAGSTCARVLADAGKRVLLIDQRDHIGGNSYDYVNADGILVHKYGAHIFHTNSREVFEFLSRFTAWRPYQHRVLSATTRGLVSVPINQTTIAAFGGDKLSAIHEIIGDYSRKQWGSYFYDRLSASVLARVPIRESSDDDRYFTDGYQMMPADGYTALFERMLDHPNITLRLSSRFDADRSDDGAKIIWTGPLDEYFGHCYGKLPYRSARFDFTTLPQAKYQPVGVVNYPSPTLPYTRIVEFKHLTGQAHPKTTIATETPVAEGEPYWPIPTNETAELAAKYRALAAWLPHVHFLGRLGSYQYFDQHQVVAQALTLSGRLLAERTA